jgi:tyrosyl-DNA phosphodiesterase 2
LESTGEHAEERMNQLRISFDELNRTGEAVNVIFGGDLNMRDKEVRNKRLIFCYSPLNCLFSF